MIEGQLYDNSIHHLINIISFDAIFIFELFFYWDDNYDSVGKEELKNIIINKIMRAWIAEQPK